jgi:hypothetical protein
MSARELQDVDKAALPALLKQAFATDLCPLSPDVREAMAIFDKLERQPVETSACFSRRRISEPSHVLRTLGR